jgi:cold shock CspA family protein
MTQFDPAIDRHLRSPIHHQEKATATTKEKSPMYFGTVSTWHDDRGFGFITSDGPVEGVEYRDVFIHAKKLPRGMKSMERGTRVEFVTVPPRVVGKPVEAKVLRILPAMAEAA